MKDIDILNKINDEFIIDNKDIINQGELEANLNMLVRNRLCSRINMFDVGYGFSRLLYISNYLINKDKKLTKYLVDKFKSYDNGIDYGKISKELNYTTDKFLSSGIYFIDLSKNDYYDFMVVIIGKEDDIDRPTGVSVYFIGDRNIKKCTKFKKELNDTIDKYFIIYPYSTIITKGTGENYTDEKFKTFDSMIFTNKDKIIKYIDNWVNNLNVYEKYNIVPKLSILIYGVPGTGKTTFVKALSKYLGVQTVTILQPPFFNKPEINSVDSDYGIILIDDIDTVCNNRDDDTSKENKAVISTLLNYLDNPHKSMIKDKNGKQHTVQLVVGTTNYYDKLDKAVKRYGRFDLQFEMLDFNKKEAEDFCSLYDLKLSDVSTHYKDKDFRISPAELQALCISNIDKRIKEKKEV